MEKNEGFSISNSALRLTVLYLTILAIICFIFSAALYSVSIREVERVLVRNPERSTRQQITKEEQILNRQIRQSVVEDLQSKLVFRIFIINLIILSVGGVLSYIFAVQTLRPIEQSKKKQERFTADSAHDLRTPLTAMKIENEIFLDSPSPKIGEAKDQIRSNLEEVNRLINLTEGLLALSSSDNTSTFVDVELGEVISSVIKVAKPIATEKSVKIEQDIGDLGQIRGNQALLERAILSVVDNAIKYSNNKSTISIIAEQSGDSRSIKVIDTGKGIAPGEIEHVFDRFYRTDSSRKKEDVGGHGLGLSIAKEIIEKHGGSIKVSSQKGKGSTFIVLL